MKPLYIKDVPEEVIDAIDLITTVRVSKTEHVRRALDLYLAQPAIQKELRRARRRVSVEAILCGVCGKDDHETEDCQHSN